jgi:hypothetical protein
MKIEKGDYRYYFKIGKLYSRSSAWTFNNRGESTIEAITFLLIKIWIVFTISIIKLDVDKYSQKSFYQGL